jgi:hypothetical protein
MDQSRRQTEIYIADLSQVKWPEKRWVIKKKKALKKKKRERKR